MLFIPALTMSNTQGDDVNQKTKADKGASLVALLAEKGFDVISLLG